MSVSLLLASLSLLWLWRTEEPCSFDTDASPRPRLSPTRSVVPGPGIPEGIGAMDSRNNLDLCRFEGRYYLAFRNAPQHFASPEARLDILSSEDLELWRLECSIDMPEGDQREPRFLVHDGRLLCYFFRAGADPLSFAPHSIYVCTREPDGRWSAPRSIWREGYVVWRLRSHGGRAYMSVYDGRDLYALRDRPGDVRLLVSEDGLDWRAISEEPQITAVGAEEGEFIRDAHGGLVATVRLEVQGSLICRAAPGDLANWNVRFTPYKLGSALLFEHRGEPWLVARRNVAGAFERGSEVRPRPLRRGWSMLRFSLTRKRTSLYRVDPAALEVLPLLDLPSRGDTGFAAIAPSGPGRYALFNYTSPLAGPDLGWILGQLGETHITHCELRFDDP